MSLHECPECEREVATNSTTAGAFSLPPDLLCVDCGLMMDVVDPDIDVDKEAVPNV